MDDDLLVTNAFYPIISVKDDGVRQEGDVEYNYYRNTEKPYLRENLGPNPEIKLVEEKTYDQRTTDEFKNYLRKKNKAQQESSFLPIGNKKIVNANQMGPTGSLNLQQDYTKKDFSSDLTKFSQIEEGFDDKNVTRLVRDTVYILNIDSRWRDGSFINYNPGTGNYNYSSTTDPWFYTITLPRPIRNVKMVEIKSSEFPYSFPCIDTTLIPNIEYNYIIMSIEELDNMDNGGIVVVNPNFNSIFSKVNSFFSKIQLNGTKPTPSGSTFIVNSTLYNNHIPYTAVYTNAIPEITKLTIRFLLPNGATYKMFDHAFTLEFITYTDSTSVTEISTRRGATDITIFNKNLK